MENKNFGHHQWRPLPIDFQTLVITETTHPDQFSSKALVTPIVNSVTFVTDSPEVQVNVSGDSECHRKYTYSPYGNPTRDVFEQALAKMDGAKHGIAFASGSAAAAAIFQILETGDHVVAMRNIFGGSFTLLKDLGRIGVTVDFVACASNVDQIKDLLKSNTKLVFLESPTNPTVMLADIEKISEAAHTKNENCVVVVDNTFLTPMYQRPLTLGADVALYSCTKYIGGHNDLVMGALTTNLDHLEKKLRYIQIRHGGVPSAFDCFLLLRSLKTLPLRLEQHAKSSLAVAKFLKNHPNVDKVLHPGLPCHENHELALRQQCGHSGIMGFYIRGGYQEAAAFLAATKIVQRAASLGGDTSLASIPSKMSHLLLSPEERADLGITDNYIRLSIGLENANSLIQDIDQALNVAVGF